VAKDGGKGFLQDPVINEKLVNEEAKAYRKYLRGEVH
jgi:hypothetical protein